MVITDGIIMRWLKCASRFSATFILWALSTLNSAWAQQSSGPVIRDTNVGYIDPAVPGDLVRFRYDAAYNNRQPTRAEFFWPGGGRGPANPETSVDYQDVSTYCELLVNQHTSVFVEAPFRWLNPEINDNAEGFGDLNAGFKYAMIDCRDLVTTLQLRTYVPSGNASEGLGTDHVSLEPAVLLYRPLMCGWCFEGELRYWVPIGGTDFAGDVIRYGAGLHYSLADCSDWQVAPVLEVVGWTALDGLTRFETAPGQFVTEDAAGDTIVNAKFGLRAKYLDRYDVYAGYGQPLTGDQWYQNTFRLECRKFF